jgi:hypothetical protein
MNASSAIADQLLRALSLMKRETQGGMSVSVSSHARYEVRFTRNALSGNFATNRHESCGLTRYKESGGTKICQWTLGAGRVSG